MIRIRESIIEEIRCHGALGYPHECCGALLGRDDGMHREVVGLLPLDNRRDGEAARRRFLVTAADHVHAEKSAREQNLEIVGFYHSHPDHPARPSEFDRDLALPWYSYVILRVASGLPGEITSWRLAEERARFEKEPIRASASTGFAGGRTPARAAVPDCRHTAVPVPTTARRSDCRRREPRERNSRWPSRS